jgi:methionyl-tRNA synthetase
MDVQNENLMFRKLVKSSSNEDKDRAATVVSFCVNLACLLAVLSEPFMPDLSKTLLKQLNISLDAVNTLSIGNGTSFRQMLPTGNCS